MLKYIVEVDDEIVCIMVFVGFGLMIFFWFCLDNFVFWKFILYIVMFYILMIVGFMGIFMEFWDKDKWNLIFNVVLLGIMLLFLLLKIVYIIWRS